MCSVCVYALLYKRCGGGGGSGGVCMLSVWCASSGPTNRTKRTDRAVINLHVNLCFSGLSVSVSVCIHYKCMRNYLFTVCVLCWRIVHYIFCAYAVAPVLLLPLRSQECILLYKTRLPRLANDRLFRRSFWSDDSSVRLPAKKVLFAAARHVACVCSI